MATTVKPERQLWLKSPERHRKDVEILRLELLDWLRKRRPGERLTLKRSQKRSNTTRDLTYKRGSYALDISYLDSVLDIDLAASTATVEPGVTMERLFRATETVGLMPAVLPEFPGITVGGAIQGAGAESSSFRHGIVHDTCLSYEVLLGDGSLVRASRDEHQDLFYGLSGSFGTLGILVSATLALVPASSHVRLSCLPFRCANAVIETAQEICTNAEKPDFLEGLVLGRDSYLLVVGEATDSLRADDHRLSLGRAWDPWYYKHLIKIAKDLGLTAASSQKAPTRQHRRWVLTLREYLFRYDRGAFWMGDPLIRKLGGGYNMVSRTLLAPLFTTRSLYSILHRVGEEFVESKVVIQDFILPSENVSDFLNYLDNEIGVYPLWLCPIRRAQEAQPLSPHSVGPESDCEVAINVGIYGRPRNRRFDPVVLNRSLEAAALARGGLKWLYARSYSTREEFWRIYDRAAYDDLRRRYWAIGVFHDLYDKVGDESRPVPGERKGRKFFSRLFWSFIRS